MQRGGRSFRPGPRAIAANEVGRGGFAVGAGWRGPAGTGAGDMRRVAAGRAAAGRRIHGSPVSALPLPRGTPPVSSIAPDLPVFPQNFALAQGADGVDYIGNTGGVLAHDGSRWELIRLPNRELVRSLAVAADGRVMVGGYNAMGWIARDPEGRLRFVDLTPRFQAALAGREFYDIWTTVVAPEGVYFRALRDVFFWDPKSGATRHWHHADRFGALVAHDGETLLQFRGEGFRRRDGDAWVALPGTSELSQLVPRVVPLRDRSLLAIGADGRWHRIAGAVATRLPVPDGIPDGERFHDAIALPDGGIALTTFEGWLYVVDANLRGWRRFRIESGHLSAVQFAQSGGLLVSGDLVLHRVGWPSPWSALGIEHGLEGSVYAVAPWGGAWYAATGGGLFRWLDDGAGPRFDRVPWMREPAMDLLAIDDRRALVASTRVLWRVEDGRLQALGEPLLNPRLLQRSRLRAERVLVGTEYGLRFVDAVATRPRVSPPANEGLDMRVSSIAETAPDEIWYGSERHGLWRATLDADGLIASQRRIGAAEGFDTGVVPAAAVLRMDDGTLIATSRRGIFRWDGARFVVDDLDGLAALRGEEERLLLAQAADGTLWAHGVAAVHRRAPGDAWRTASIGTLRRGAITRATVLDGGGAAFASSHALLLHDPTVAPAGGVASAVRLRSVQHAPAPDGTTRHLPLAPGGPPAFAFGDDTLRFTFALPDAGPGGMPVYSVRIVGLPAPWSDWSPAGDYVSSRLAPGAYAFEVRARDAAGRISSAAPWPFVVLAPWHATPAARLGAVLLALLVLLALTRAAVRWRTHRLALEKRALADEVAARTRDLAEANERLGRMAHLDGLTGIANRRRLDEYLDLAWRQSRERARPIALVAIDVDHFKRYNDTRGHVAGDALLRELPRRLLPCLRRGEDLLGRYGGEEFLAVLPGADLALARDVAEAMRAAVESSPLGVTVSIGVAAACADDGPATALMERADAALYAAKHGGRNRVVAAGHDGEPPAPGEPANEDPTRTTPRRQAAS